MSGVTTLLAAGGEAAGQVKEFHDPNWFAAVLIGVLAVCGSVMVLGSAVAMYLAPDALSQINMVGPAVGVGLPLLVAANLVYSWSTEGFILAEFVKAIVAIVALLVVAAMGSFIMGRALHATHWDHTVPLSGGERAKEPR
ncbi:Na+/H+ antiporter subunit G [Corynebacterium bovis]|uniref:Na+/H+ antiporter subunit G n=2 Tax=Corynebacterium bovis TaxID=36808 RepID=A0A3R8PNX5_9CORY|nr:Na+/H+ antiporter subunit G [Corynebacterium bovis]MBB3116190.1 multicomponent Na+:H+ antiporter subunit G [Corynebacterium bovis DSM 20582 = CIP 54.80]MDK8511507.1 Na+/H+ antiporter subunit G [Corynebacterium bovis]MDN8580374.1 Na+/H+ antiporter subunit G [Corynebacterium bovis]QQC47108.1 Na+/H+ antiporter subunit G [Corynebacterium bovis]RRO78982.1 Na+/H+ antiporter subunit G [Corynebacterium bovis]